MLGAASLLHFTSLQFMNNFLLYGKGAGLGIGEKSLFILKWSHF